MNLDIAEMQNPIPFKSPPKKLCILRLSALGDVTHVIPVIRQIQNQWPDCEITWICGVFEYKFLKLIQGVRFILFDKRQGIRSYLKLRKELRKEHFDVLLHMQLSGRANLVSLFVNADIRLGWDNARSRELHHLFINHSVPVALRQHQQDGFLSFGHALGLSHSPPEWDLPITENAKQFVDENISADKPLLLISACSSHKLRNWSAQSYAAVADYAINTHNMTVVLSGGPSDIELKMAEAITKNMKCEALNLVGKDTLEQLIGLLDRADIVLSPDSGPAHLANAVGTRVIGLYACTWSKRSGPYNSQKLCVDKYDEVALTYMSKNAEDLRWGKKIELPDVMDTITVKDVCDKLDEAMLASSMLAS